MSAIKGGGGSEANDAEQLSNTGYHRKYAIRLLNGAPPGKQPERRRGERFPRYGPQVLSVLAAIWEAGGYPWSVRLKALLPNWMPWIRKRYQMTPAMEKQLWASVLGKWTGACGRRRASGNGVSTDAPSRARC